MHTIYSTSCSSSLESIFLFTVLSASGNKTEDSSRDFLNASMRVVKQLVFYYLTQSPPFFFLSIFLSVYLLTFENNIYSLQSTIYNYTIKKNRYKNVRPDYVAAIWDVVNWGNVAERFEAAK